MILISLSENEAFSFSDLLLNSLYSGSKRAIIFLMFGSIITFRLSSFANCLFTSFFFSNLSIKPVTAPVVQPHKLENSPAVICPFWIKNPKYL